MLKEECVCKHPGTCMLGNGGLEAGNRQVGRAVGDCGYGWVSVEKTVER